MAKPRGEPAVAKNRRPVNNRQSQKKIRRGADGKLATYKYSRKYVDELVEYFNVKPFAPMMKKVVLKDGTTLVNPETGLEVEVQATDKFGTPLWVPCEMPTFAGFAADIGVCKNTLTNWGKRNPEFQRALDRCKARMEHIIVVNGLNKNFDARFASLASKNMADWKDKIEHSGDAANPIAHRVIFAPQKKKIEEKMERAMLPGEEMKIIDVTPQLKKVEPVKAGA